MRRGAFLSSTSALGAGLVVGLSLPTVLRPSTAQAATDAAGGLQANAWVHVGTDGRVAIFLAKSEMGQGIYTGLPMALAEELDYPIERVEVVKALAEPQYGDKLFLGDMTTGGSTSTATSYMVMRQAGATARAMLVAAAAKRLNVPEGELKTAKGYVWHGTTAIAYADLAQAASAVPVPKDVKLKDPAQFTLIGTSPQRLDLADKVHGTAIYGIDVRIPGMLYASIEKAPTFGGTVKSYDASAAKKVHGVLEVVPVSTGIAVVATNTWSAFEGRKKLKIAWNNGPDVGRQANTKEMLADALATAKAGGKPVPHMVAGDVDAAPGKVIEATYTGPYLSHAPMEPQNATADVRRDHVEIWAPTQVQTRCQQVAMKITGLPADKVIVHTTFLGGGFGRRLDPDYVVDAVEVSKAIGKPVKVQWTREDDVKHDFYRPMSVNVVRAKLADDGKVTAWSHELTSSSIMKRWLPPAFAGGVDAFAMDGTVPEGYGFPAVRGTFADWEPGVPVGFMRAPGGNFNCFATESFIDELAHAAGMDPVKFRLANLGAKGERDRAVLEWVAEHSDWGRRKGVHQGVAIARWAGSIIAMVADCQVAGKQVHVRHLTMAADCGTIVHPDIVVAQLQGAANYGLAMAMSAKITLTNGRIDQNNFYDYTVLRMKDAPSTTIHVMKNGLPPTGVGELATPPVAPAVGNAIFAATGKRVRSLPFSDALA